MKPSSQPVEPESGEGESELERIKQVRTEVDKRIANHTGQRYQSASTLIDSCLKKYIYILGVARYTNVTVRYDLGTTGKKKNLLCSVSFHLF